MAKTGGKQARGTTAGTKRQKKLPGKAVKGGGAGAASPGKKKKDPKKKKTKDPVSIASGAVVEEVIDLHIPGLIDFTWTRTYSSADAAGTTPMGRGGWTHSYNLWVDSDGDALVFHSAGDEVEFAAAEIGEASFNRGERLELRRGRDGRCEILDLDTRLTRDFAPIVPGGPAMLQSIRDVWGNRIQLAYDGGVLTTIVDTARREVRVLHGDHGHVARLEVWVEGALVQHFDYAYTSAGELAAAANALGHALRYAYDGKHRLVDKALRTGIWFHYAYEEDHGRCVKSWGDGGLYHVELIYDFEAKTTTTHGNLEPRVYTWNDAGAVVKEASFDGEFVEENVYDDDGLLITETDAAGLKQGFEHDERGNLIKYVDRAGNETILEYQGDLLTAVLFPDGTQKRYAYESHGAREAVTLITGETYSRAFDGRGREIGFFGPDGRLDAREYDDQNNNVRAIDARGATAEFGYDALGRPISRVDGLGRVSRAEYDAIGQLLVNRHPDGTSTEHMYDPSGSIVRTRKSNGDVITAEYVGTGSIAKYTGEDGQSWLCTYDREENILFVENPKAERYGYRYDAMGRVYEERTFDGRTIKYRWSKDGRIARIENPDGTWRAFQHDPLGNLVLETSPHGTQEHARDGFGRLISATVDEDAAKIVVALERDELGRVVAETQDGATVRYEYDARWRRSARILPGGQTTRYFYDVMGDVSALDHDGHKVLIERDPYGRETRKHVFAGNVDIQSSWDVMDRLVERRAVAPPRPGGATHEILSRRTWGHDSLGRVTSSEDAHWGATHYAYDELSQLTEARRANGREIFEYDAAGSLSAAFSALTEKMEPWSIGQGNVLVRSPPAEYGYDENKQRTTRERLEQHRPTGEITHYTWDCRSRLREVKQPDGSAARYFYDAFGRRVRKEISTPDVDASPRVVRYLWDVHVLCQESDSERGERIFVHELDSFVPLLQQEQGEIFTYVNDDQGLPRELIDNSGRVAWSASYSAWGVLAASKGDAARPRVRPIASPFRLLGQYADDETGLAYTRLRYFDPEVGRWCSPDPIGFRGGPNLFAFIGSPTLVADPFGLDPIPLSTPGYGVYGLYPIGSPASATPTYVGITNDFDVREGASGHGRPGQRLDPNMGHNLEMRELETGLTYGEARGSEQARIELDGLRTGKPPGNVVNSIAPERAKATDQRSKDLVAAYKKKKAALKKERAAAKAKAAGKTK